MKALKKICFVMFISTALLCALLFSSASAKGDVVVSLQIDNPIMKVNGLNTDIDAGRGTTPIISNGRTLVPVRAIIEAFGGAVSWDDESQSAVLTLEGDVIQLPINSHTAFFNGTPKTLDVSPVIINERTMLPIRFVAESFNLAVAWDNSTSTVYVIENTFDESEYNYVMAQAGEYSGNPYVYINNNNPLFKEYEIIEADFEYYSSLDELERCNVCMASIDKDIMPVEERKSISSVTPTGWKNASYGIVPGGYVYNRCHLIGYQLTGENDNERNLITGTRYLNIEGMLGFENEINEYIETTGNSVMYRVTPVFKENNLVADGVLLEAYSVEDNGAGISFCVYCYNVQPGIFIDYLSGETFLNEQTAARESVSSTESSNNGVYRTPTGKRYHFDFECGGKNSYSISLEEALAIGLTPCAKCTD